MSLRRYFIVMSVLTLAALLAGLAVLAARQAESHPADSAETAGLSVFGRVDGFELLASTGEAFNAEQMRGKVWVADFIFTSCNGLCPMMTDKMAELYRAFSADDRVHFVSLSVDPANDTPEVLAAYAARYEADTSRWHFLTGEGGKVHALATQTFKIGSLDEPLDHSVRFILVDGEGAIRSYYLATESDDVDRLAEDISRLLDQDEA